MNVTINIYGDVHIHCDCCNECGVYDDNFDDALEAPHEAVPDAEDGGEQTGPTAEEAEAAVKALAAFFLPLFSEETDEGGGLRRVPPGAGADAGAADPQGERRLFAGAGRTEPADHRAAARGKIAMAHRAATDEICVTGGYGERPIKQKAGTRQSLRLLSFGSKRPCLPRLSGTSHYSGRALFPVYMRKPKQARETNCYKGSFTKLV